MKAAFIVLFAVLFSFLGYGAPEVFPETFISSRAVYNSQAEEALDYYKNAAFQGITMLKDYDASMKLLTDLKNMGLDVTAYPSDLILQVFALPGGNGLRAAYDP